MNLEDFVELIPALQEAAKDKWGERVLKPLNQAFDDVVKEGWNTHLAELITAPDPEKYLKENPEPRRYHEQ